MRTQAQGSGAGTTAMSSTQQLHAQRGDRPGDPVSRATEALLKRVPRLCRGLGATALRPGPRNSSRLQAGAAGVWGCWGARHFPRPPLWSQTCGSRPAPVARGRTSHPSCSVRLSVISLLEAARFFPVLVSHSFWAQALYHSPQACF